MIDGIVNECIAELCSRWEWDKWPNIESINSAYNEPNYYPTELSNWRGSITPNVAMTHITIGGNEGLELFNGH